MIRLGLIAKMMGGKGPEQLKDLLRAAGIDADFAPVKREEAFEAFIDLSQAADSPAASLLRIRIGVGNDQTTGLLVIQESKKL